MRRAILSGLLWGLVSGLAAAAFVFVMRDVVFLPLLVREGAEAISPRGPDGVLILSGVFTGLAVAVLRASRVAARMLRDQAEGLPPGDMRPEELLRIHRQRDHAGAAPPLESLRPAFERAGQGHIFRFVDRLDASERAAFARQLAAVDLDWVAARYDQYRREQERTTAAAQLKPAPVVPVPDSDEDRRREARARETGQAALCEGRLAAFLVAGGQGTRLGFDGPKGRYPIGAVTGRTLFRIHAEQIRARAARYGVRIPWYVMTSEANDAATREAFEQNDFYGVAPEDVFFLQQANVPALDFDGKLVLAEPGRLATSPNGHGGCLQALVDSGALEDMRRRGVDTISYFQVDNALVTICDPVFAGYHLQAGAQMSSKVVEKTDPSEKVGIVCRKDGKLCVVEYSDLDDETARQRDPDGKLRFRAGSIAIHMLGVDFAERVGSGTDLPWHVAVKKVAHIDDQGRPVDPDEPNGLKFERFVFDALPLARETATMEVVRDEEFAPVKNQSGPDSPDTSRRLQTEYAARMLEAAGFEVPRDDQGRAAGPIELSYLFALDAEDLRDKLEPGFRVSGPAVLE